MEDQKKFIVRTFSHHFPYGREAPAVRCFGYRKIATETADRAAEHGGKAHAVRNNGGGQRRMAPSLTVGRNP